MRIQTKRTIQVALVSGGLLMVGAAGAAAAETPAPGVPALALDQLVTNPVLNGVADTADHLQAAQAQAGTGVDLGHPAQALTTVLPAVTQQRPAPATAAPASAAVLHTVPLHLLQQDPAPSAEVSGDLPEQDINAPLGSELAATDLPVLPATGPLTATADTVPGQATVTPVDGRLPVLPLRGDVSTQPLDPGAGTRVTGVHTAAAPAEVVQPAAPVRPPAVPARDRRADTPSATLPLLGGLLPNTNGVLPTPSPASNGVSDLSQPASLAGLTQLAGSTPLNHGGHYNTGAVTAPVFQHGPGALVESATTLLRK
jgi:hypothetical protein